MQKLFLGFVLGIVAVLWGAYWFLHHGYFDPRADAPVSAIERSIAGPALDNAVARRAPKIENPVTGTGENLILGMKVYQTNCALCHGDVQHRRAPLANALSPAAPQFLVTAPDMPDSQNFYIVKHGIRLSGMPAWNGLLTDQQIWQVTTFLRRMNNLPPEVERQWKTAAGAPPAPTVQTPPAETQ